MTVEEAIKKLKKLNPKAELLVWMRDFGAYGTLKEVNRACQSEIDLNEGFEDKNPEDLVIFSTK